MAMEEESAMLIDFFLLQPNIGGNILKPLLKKLLLQIHKNDPRIIQCILLQKLSSDVVPISENTLDVLEKLEEFYYSNGITVLDSMKEAYCAVAVHCTVIYLKQRSGGSTFRDYFEAVIRIWRGRVCDMYNFENVGLVSSKLREMKGVIEEVIWNESVMNNVLTWDTLGDAVKLVGVFLRDAFKEFGESRLQFALKEMMDEAGNVASTSDSQPVLVEHSHPRAEIAECQLPSPQIEIAQQTNGNDLAANSVSEISRAANARFRLLTPQVERVCETLGISSSNLQAAVEDPHHTAAKDKYKSPSTNNFCTRAMGATLSVHLVLPKVNTRLGKWLIAKSLNFSCDPSSMLNDILKTPMMPLKCVNSESPMISKKQTQEKVARKLSLDLVPLLISSSVITEDPEKSNVEALPMVDEGFEDIQKSIERLSLVQCDDSCEEIQKSIERLSLAQCDEGCEEIQKSIERISLAQCLPFLDDNQQDPFTSLLRACKQSAPSTLLDLFSQHCDPGSIKKIGEGTFGEAFRAGGSVCKTVPIDGDLLVNGEVQKRSLQMLEEVLLSWALNSLKGQEGDLDNTCRTFIETIDVRVCQGVYDASLIKAWEDWKARHNLGNDHPNIFSGKQCYLVFVLAHGGEDLESFVLSNFEEAQSLLVQVAAALAVAEAAYEFEHRDLHWGNILLTQMGDETVKFVLGGRQMWARTFGLSISIIDFTLSRINTGEATHYLDLSNDPALFDGPKDCKQSETYRKMREVTGECWEGSFPKTNVLWLQYLVDILLHKKSFSRSQMDERDLRALKKRLGMCCSAKEAIADPFFSSLLLDHDITIK